MGLTEQEIAEALFAAIKGRAKDKRSAWKTIEDGVRDGMGRPHTYPQGDQAWSVGSSY